MPTRTYQSMAKDALEEARRCLRATKNGTAIYKRLLMEMDKAIKALEV